MYLNPVDTPDYGGVFADMARGEVLFSNSAVRRNRQQNSFDQRPTLTSRFRGRCRQSFLALCVILAMSSCAVRNEGRLVPQFDLVNLDPLYVAFSPTNDDQVVVLNRGGRVDLLDISDWPEQYRTLEIDASAQCLGFSPDGKSLVSGGIDGAVRIWDVETGMQKGDPFKGHDGLVSSVSFDISGQRIVSGGMDKTVRIWDVNSGMQLRAPLEGHQELVVSVAFSADRSQIISGGIDRAVRIWDAESGELLRVVLESREDAWSVSSVAFSPDGKQIVSGDNDGNVRLRDAESSKLVHNPFGGHRGPVSSVAYSPDGKRFVSGGIDGRVGLWDAETGISIGIPLAGHSGRVTSVAFSSDGKRILSSGSDGELRLWREAYVTPIPLPFIGHDGDVYSVEFGPGGERILSGSADGSVRLWDAQNGHLLLSVDAQHGEVYSVRFGHSGEHIVTGGEDGLVRTWHAGNGTLIGEPLEGHEDWVKSVAFSPDGKRIVSGSDDDTVRIWDAESGTAIGDALEGHEDWVNSVAFSPDGKRIVSGSDDGTVRIWDAESGTAIGDALEGHEDWVFSVAFSPDGKRIVSGGSDGTVRIWNAESGTAIGDPLEGHEDWVNSVAFSPDGKRIVSGSDDGTIRMWDAETGTPSAVALVGGDGWVGSVAFSPDGRRIVSGIGETVRLWSTEGFSHVEEPAKDTVGRVVSFAFRIDARQLVASHSDGIVRMWEIEAGTSSAELFTHHHGGVGGIEIRRDGKRVFTGGVDGHVRIWDTDSGELIGESLDGHRGAVLSIAISRDGKHIVSGGDDGVVRTWDVSSGTPIQELTHERDGDLIGVAISDDGDRVISANDVGRLEIHLTSDELQGAPLEKIRATSAVFIPKTNSIVYVGYGMIGRLNLNTANVEHSTVARPSCNEHDYKMSLAYNQNQYGIQLLSSNVIAIKCGSRAGLFDLELNYRGGVFLTQDGVVATLDDQGVFTSKRELKDLFVAYDGTIGRVTPNRIATVSTMREVLFAERDWWALLKHHGQNIYDFYIRPQDELKGLVNSIRIATPLVLLSLIAAAMWLICPACLAWWSMPRGVPDPQKRKVILRMKYIGHTILLFGWLARTSRPLKSWFKKNRTELERHCFMCLRQVQERERYCPIDPDDTIAFFSNSVREKERGLVWIYGVGGSGKSSLAMFILREVTIGKSKHPVPVLVDEDWDGSLAAQVATQLRMSTWKKGPDEGIIKKLGALGLICPLVDSLSERVTERPVASVKQAITSLDFRHLVVTSRERPPQDQIWQSVRQITPRDLKQEDVPRFIEAYLPGPPTDRKEQFERDIQSLLSGKEMPSPLFLRFLIEQAWERSIRTIDPLSLVLEYLDALRFGKIDIRRSDMERAASVAAVTSVHDELRPLAFSEERLRGALDAASNDQRFYIEDGTSELSPPMLVDALVESGVFVRRKSDMRFSYDPVAEYLAAWRVREAPDGTLDVLRGRITGWTDTGVARAYRDVSRADRK